MFACDWAVFAPQFAAFILYSYMNETFKTVIQFKNSIQNTVTIFGARVIESQ